MTSGAAPDPPADLARRKPAIIVYPPEALLHRFYVAEFGPRFFDRSASGRFNAPDASYGVMYLAATESGAFAETFLRVSGRTLLPADVLARRAYACFRVEKPISLIKLSGPGLARVGATAQVCHGGLPYDGAQGWSAALHDHPSVADGIAYTARHDDEAGCIALFERASTSITEVEPHRRLDLDQDWFWVLAETYGVGRAP